MATLGLNSRSVTYIQYDVYRRYLKQTSVGLLPYCCTVLPHTLLKTPINYPHCREFWGIIERPNWNSFFTLSSLMTSLAKYYIPALAYLVHLLRALLAVVQYYSISVYKLEKVVLVARGTQKNLKPINSGRPNLPRFSWRSPFQGIFSPKRVCNRQTSA